MQIKNFGKTSGMKIEDFGELSSIRAKLGRVGIGGVRWKYRGSANHQAQSRKPTAGSYNKNDVHLVPQCRERVSRTGEHPRSRHGHTAGRAREARAN